MSFSTQDFEGIINNPQNSFLKKDPQEKYEVFKSIDPFPKISDALLNSVSILKYILVTGMITPFDIEKVGGVTYTCHFSGRYYYWEHEGCRREGELCDDEGIGEKELILRPNSITYLEVRETFRVPDYIVIRYNLEVMHVYKGLLLGTGPIIDPSFVGQLFIPLHNLTANEYIIKKDSSIITLEFTKVGRNTGKWPLKKDDSIPEYRFDFEDIKHQRSEITPNRPFKEYITKALFKKKEFRKKGDIEEVSNSIPNSIFEATKSAKSAEDAANNAKESAESAKKTIDRISRFAPIPIIISICALLFASNARFDSLIRDNYSIIQENKEILEENTALSEKVSQLEKYITELSDELEFIKDTIPKSYPSE